MVTRLEYHQRMRRSISAFIASVSVMALMFFFVASSHAQVNGPPASVTSPGFGGNPINGAAPSVTSLGPHGYPSGPVFVGPPVDGGHRGHGKDGRGSKDGRDGREHHGHDGQSGALLYAVPVPYAVDQNAPEPPEAEGSDADAADQGGPTVFDHRGPGRVYDSPERDVKPSHAKAAEVAEAEEPPAEPEPPQEPTLLVYKDGRSVEVGNYAIQGATLFDLTPGHRRKIALMDLDLDATRKQNEERGVTFQLPSSYKAK
jgi:hypothetical protein